MTAHRRPLLVAAAAALFLPGCLTIQARSTSSEEPGRPAHHAEGQAKVEAAKKTDFRVFPSRPGETVAINPSPKDAATAQQTSEKPRNDPPPQGGVTVAGNPGLFPLGPSLFPAPAEPPLLAAVRAYAEGRPDRAIEILKQLPPANQELLLAVLPVLARASSADLISDPVAVAILAEQLRAAGARLEPRAALRVENVAFCRKVDGFGLYDPRPPGQPYRPNDQAQLYFEVQNLPSQPASGPRGETHATHARVSVEIRDAHGTLVEQPDPADWRRRVKVAQFETRRFTRGPIHDFHLIRPITVPGEPGVYDVTVEVRDPTGRRVVRSEPVRFDVAGP